MWYVTARGTKKGPITESQLISLIQAGDVVADDMVWKKGMAEWENVTIHFGSEFSSSSMGAGAFGSAFNDPNQPPAMPGGSNPYTSPAPPDSPVRSYHPHHSPSDPNRLAAALLAIFLGAIGIHKFYLGYKSAGVIMLVVSIATCGLGAIVMNLIGLIEGIIYITRSDEDFYHTYVQYEKPWF